MTWRICVVAMLFVMSVFMPGTARACSCAGTASIGTALSRSEIVVVGRIKRRGESPPQSSESVVEVFPDPVVVEVIEVLKGNAPAEVLVSTDLFCYRTFDVEELEIGETFVLPIGREKHGVRFLPACSHSGLKLMDGELYTNEFARGGGRRLDHYMSLTMLRILLPLGVLDARRQAILAGGLALLSSWAFTRRIRNRKALTVGNSPSGPKRSVRSLRWRSGFAIAWMLLCAGALVLAGLSEWDWTLWALGALFAFTAAGIAFLWRWSEGVSYGLALIWIGGCAYLTYDALSWYFAENDEVNRHLLYFLGIAFACVAGMTWCAHAVRRRFSECA